MPELALDLIQALEDHQGLFAIYHLGGDRRWIEKQRTIGRLRCDNAHSGDAMGGG